MLPIGDDNVRGRGPALVTYGLIALSVLVFFVELNHPTPAALQSFIASWGVVPTEYSTGLNALPLVGGLKMVIETFTGDWFRDRPRPPATPALSGLGEEVRAAHSLRPSSRKRHS